MSRLTWAQLSEIDARLELLGAWWIDASGLAIPSGGLNLSEHDQWELLDRLNRLVVAVTNALPNAEGELRIGGQLVELASPAAIAEAAAAEMATLGTGNRGGLE